MAIAAGVELDGDTLRALGLDCAHDEDISAITAQFGMRDVQTAVDDAVALLSLVNLDAQLYEPALLMAMHLGDDDGVQLPDGDALASDNGDVPFPQDDAGHYLV